jgi:hypothetical protein
MTRFFNTAGPVDRDRHYCLPPLERFDLEHILVLIEQQKYFVLHAPRQTGKTSSLLALMDHLNQQETYRCLYANFEKGQSAREDVRRGMRAVVGEIASRARDYLQDGFPLEQMATILEKWGEDSALNELLSQWSQNSPKPLVLLVDEIDSLVGDTLISVLRQIRAGYDKRPSHFPQSIILCGVRDVRDYRIHSDKDKTVVSGGSAFNIKAESLRLGNFSREETAGLYAIHTGETGQPFTPEALELAWEYTQGQPWLVNALGYETCFRMREGRDRDKPIDMDIMIQAKENLILRRETHLDQLADKLKEDRVRRVIGPILEGTSIANIPQDEIQYVLDLGLITRSASGLEIANAIYREIIPRELTTITQYNLEPLYQPSWYILPDGRLDTNGLLTAFQEFFRENAEIWLERFDYREAGPHLLLQAFLQRIVNSGGRIDREYGLGRKRTDLLVIRKYETGVQKVVIELKILRKSLDHTISEGLAQTADYMDKCGSSEGHLIIFDRNPEKPWEEKTFRRNETHDGKTITVWGM